MWDDLTLNDVGEYLHGSETQQSMVTTAPTEAVPTEMVVGISILAILVILGMYYVIK